MAGGSAGGSAGGATGGGSGGGAVLSADVTGHCVETWISDTDAGTRPCQYGANLPQAIITTDAGVTTIAATVNPDGTFSLPNVPQTLYFLKVGTSWFQTAERALNLDFTSRGRIDTALAGSGTSLILSVSGLQPWDETFHFTSLVSSNAGISMEAFSNATGDIPFDGDTRYTFDIPWDLYSQQLFTPMLDASKGDSALVMQMEYDPATSEYRMLGVGTASPVTMVSGSTNSASVVLSSPPASTTPLELDLPTFSMTSSDFTTGSTQPGLTIELSAGPSPVHERSGDGDSLSWGFYPQPGSGTVPPNPLTFPNAFPSSWGHTATVTFATQLTRLAAGSTQPRRYASGVTMVVALQTLSTPLAAALGPPKDVQINGAPFGTTLMGATRTPTVTWNAPSLGSPTRYLLRIEQLSASQGRTIATPVASFYLAASNTSFTVPTGVMVTNQTYVLQLSAYRTPGALERDLYDFRYPLAIGTVVSGLVRP